MSVVMTTQYREVLRLLLGSILVLGVPADLPPCEEPFIYFPGVGCMTDPLIPHPMNYTQAIEYCQSIGGYLLEPSTDEIQGFIFDNLFGSVEYDYWLSLRRNGSEFIWDHSQQPLSFDAWGVDEPNLNQDCAMASVEHSFFWATSQCDVERGVICNAPERLGLCSGPKWTFVEQLDQCFLWDTDSMSWENAVDFCKSQGDRVHLVEILNSKKNEILKEALSNDPIAYSKGSFWMGLNDREREGQYIWENSGLEASFFDWSENQPAGDAQDCTVMYYGGNFQWYDSDCPSFFYPLCEEDAE
ncbi:hypothetical protein TCAL_09052 [Tigriopus californicus]|uniref:C-type lectin domain-containing protein n=1 Tax=Tigriopus californicus TaxID=6832 RepID=A0A553P3A5_TIGCA|nr:macrophage mannose receptor 1-like [Tigriopus californicus]TRY72163.1 hypothetical protein TCAL_09052 [Tigriopus californicus]|eukprot:TCALIF_09052-PA protein Name:"Similar to Mrc1 Macrophage mannose receptor 1 (Mus musculus)" AED:0.00 eAED:0.01 QI:1013/1/0.66/1/1/1/3/0/299